VEILKRKFAQKKMFTFSLLILTCLLASISSSIQNCNNCNIIVTRGPFKTPSFNLILKLIFGTKLPEIYTNKLSTTSTTSAKIISALTQNLPSTRATTTKSTKILAFTSTTKRFSTTIRPISTTTKTVSLKKTKKLV
jgi:hypothetical protein